MLQSMRDCKPKMWGHCYAEHVNETTLGKMRWGISSSQAPGIGHQAVYTLCGESLETSKRTPGYPDSFQCAET